MYDSPPGVNGWVHAGSLNTLSNIPYHQHLDVIRLASPWFSEGYQRVEYHWSSGSVWVRAAPRQRYYAKGKSKGKGKGNGTYFDVIDNTDVRHAFPGGGE